MTRDAAGLRPGHVAYVALLPRRAAARRRRSHGCARLEPYGDRRARRRGPCSTTTARSARCTPARGGRPRWPRARRRSPAARAAQAPPRCRPDSRPSTPSPPRLPRRAARSTGARTRISTSVSFSPAGRNTHAPASALRSYPSGGSGGRAFATEATQSSTLTVQARLIRECTSRPGGSLPSALDSARFAWTLVACRIQEARSRPRPNRTGGSCASHCYRMLGSFDDAEDLVQETLLRAWRGRGRLRGPLAAPDVALPHRHQRLPQRARARAAARDAAGRGRRRSPPRPTPRGARDAAARAARSRGSTTASPTASPSPSGGVRARRSSWRSSPRCSTCRRGSARSSILRDVLGGRRRRPRRCSRRPSPPSNSALQRAHATMRRATGRRDWRWPRPPPTSARCSGASWPPGSAGTSPR